MAETTATLADVLPPAPDGVAIDDVFALLADGHRRQLLVVLRALEGPEHVSTLARNLAIELDGVGDDAGNRLHARLVHVHVPKLRATGVVVPGARPGTIELTEYGRRLAAVLGS